MENLEEDLGDVITTTTPDVEAEVIDSMESGPPAAAANINLNDSVEIIETPIDVLDLTSPQPSTSTNCSNSAGAVGTSSLVKRNLEETLKETSNTDQNPSTSTSAASASSSTPGNVLECPICLQTCIHPARLPCGHIFCFLCVKGVAYKNRRCAMCRREIPPEFLDHPQLVNGIEDICTTKATDDGYQWFYEGRNGGWWAYEKRNASEIEEAFQNLFNKHLPNSKTLKADIKKEAKAAIKGNKLANESDEESENDGEDDFASDSDEGEASDNKQNVANTFTHNIQVCGSMYTVDFLNMIQYPQCMPYRKRKICRAKGLPSKGVAGLLTTKRNRWWQYDDRTSQDLEEAFKKGERSCTILVAGYVYIVDFDAMIQQRQNEPARCRRVKRDLATIPKKGVAGLRIEGNTVTTDSNFAAQVYQSRQNRYRSGELLNEGDLESSDYPLLRNHSATDPASPNNPQGRLRLSYGGLGGYVIELGNPSEFVSTAAATDAALRIASDIIGSTLAHADELTRSAGNNLSHASSSSSHAYNQRTINNQDSAVTSSSTGELSLNDLTLTHTQLTASPNTATTVTSTAAGNGLLGPSSSGGVNLTRERGSRELLGAAEDLLGATQRVIATADQPTIDLFEQTLNDFHTLTLRNIVDTSDDDNDADDNSATTEQQQILPTTPNTSTGGQRSSSSHSYNQENPS